MKSFIMKGLLVLIVPSLCFAINSGYYADVGVGVSLGSSYLIAPSSDFTGSGGSLSGGITDMYGLNTQGSVAAYANLGFNFLPNFGIEANYTYWGYQSLSTFTGQITSATGEFNGNVQSQSVGGNLVGYIPLNNEQVNIYSKLGLAELFSRLTIDDPSGNIFFNAGKYGQSDSQLAVTYGAGVLYSYKPYLSFTLGWSGISQAKGATIRNINYNMAAIGMRYIIPNKIPNIFRK